MGKRLILLVSFMLMALSTVQSCSSNQTPPATTASEASPTSAGEEAATGQGTLEIRANGEDFVRKGFTSKDGWQISFDQVYATLSEVTAYQTEPPYDPQVDGELKAEQQASLDKTQTVDLAAGGETAAPVLVGEVKAPAGRYNALSWKLVKATEEPAQGYPLLIQGKATKGGNTINFALKINQELAYSCGDFVGDDRKGQLKPGDKADLEATFHFDHLFGDAETPLTDDLNKQALGFQPLAAIAQNGKLDADTTTLEQSLSAADYQKFESILPSLGHVGEGHCKETMMGT
ncbi:MAG: DUF4382 domain-containing protein [Leptolyngbyaceae cyanobacterium RU_5_1]|nr:DUF4382 domain-containing protein [Leptolyngbyaceae cyanobacterium RU_5_1]